MNCTTGGKKKQIYQGGGGGFCVPMIFDTRILSQYESQKMILFYQSQICYLTLTLSVFQTVKMGQYSSNSKKSFVPQ